MKRHVALDHDGCLPAFVNIARARVHDSCKAEMPRLAKGSMAALDKAHVNRAWLRSLVASALFFVTRPKADAACWSKRRRLGRKGSGARSAHRISVTGRGRELPLRRIGCRDPETGTFCEFLTKHLKLSARTIAGISRGRRQIGVFFGLIKKKLQLQSFVGTSENAFPSRVCVVKMACPRPVWFRFKSGIAFSRCFSRSRSSSSNEGIWTILANRRGFGMTNQDVITAG